MINITIWEIVLILLFITSFSFGFYCGLKVLDMIWGKKGFWKNYIAISFFICPNRKDKNLCRLVNGMRVSLFLIVLAVILMFVIR